MKYGFCVLLSLAVLSACGGGGGVNSVGVTPAPPSSPPPTGGGGNGGGTATITNPGTNPSFAVDGATSTPVFDLTTKTTVSAAGAASVVAVNYDAGSNSYTIQTSGRSQTFSPADATNSGIAGVATYKKSGSPGSDYLTLITTPLESTIANQYVGLGFWQRNQVSGTTQQTTFDIFSYGFSTPAAAVPRSGTANYAIDAFGFLTHPGLAPQTLQGLGTFNVDFAAGIFSASAYLTQYDITTNSSLSGGGIQILASGNLSGTDGSFNGNIAYQNTPDAVAGPLKGRLYGPAGQELGASFAADNAAGTVLVGGFTGQRGQGGTTTTLTLGNIVGSQLSYALEAELQAVADSSGALVGANTYQAISQVTLQPDGSFLYVPGKSDLTGGTFTRSDQVAGPANFTTYQKVVNGEALKVMLFNVGSGNAELALTYASFGIWQQDSGAPNTLLAADKTYFSFGLATPLGVLSRRTGTAHYTGVAYGGAVDSELPARYTVHGTSVFDVDFGAQQMSGNLALTGTIEGGSTTRDFGAFSFAGATGSNGSTLQVSQGAANVGQLVNQFFGPGGEEIAGTFVLHVNPGGPHGGLAIAGVTAAKRQ